MSISSHIILTVHRQRACVGENVDTGGDGGDDNVAVIVS